MAHRYLIALALSLAATAANAEPGSVPVPQGKVYFGISEQPTTSAPSALEQSLGMRADIVEFNNHITDQLHLDKLAALKMLGAHYPYLSLALAQPHATLRDTIDNDGSNVEEKPDDYYRGWAQALKAYGRPVFLRWGVEMNRPNFPWCALADQPNCAGQTPQDFVAAWRHIHGIFKAAGATNVAWVWCPSADPMSRYDPTYGDLASMYPGSAYVDWTCLDVYNKPQMTHRWLSFDEVLTPPLNAILQFAPDKPMMIGETNAVPDSRRAQWFADALKRAIPAHPQIKAVVVWQANRADDPDLPARRQIDWNVEDDPATLDAVKSALSAPPYSLPPLGR
ncbi:MAG TPA: glycosyl hydrolase [Rhizomicrobium sp.]|nr:glycosyl hydrolase [Rhizomicrobium sp.]